MSGEIELVGKTTIGGVQFDMSYSDGAIQKAQYGITDDYYGGMLKEFRKVKGYDGIMLCLDKRDNIINVAYVESELCNNGRVLLGFEPIEEPLVASKHPATDNSNVSTSALSAENLDNVMKTLEDIVDDKEPTEAVGDTGNDEELTEARRLLGVEPAGVPSIYSVGEAEDAVNEIINAKAKRKR